MGIVTAGASSSVYLLPGMSVKLHVKHFFVSTTPIPYKNPDGSSGTKYLINGFSVANSKVGSITKVSGEPAVIYKHNKFEANTITFYALTGEKGRVEITSVPIHDHSSIVAGGPAYGSYYSDDQTVTKDED